MGAPCKRRWPATSRKVQRSGARGRRRAADRLQQLDQDHARHESADVCPDRDAAGFHRRAQGAEAFEELHEEPEDEVDDRRNLDEPRQEEHRHEGEDARARIRDQIRAENAGDGSGGADGLRATCVRPAAAPAAT